LLFAPVYFSRPLWSDPNWCYRPNYVVNLADLVSCLFVRPAYCHYYFGDYYDPAYVRLGFSPWLAVGARSRDPLFGYYRWTHRRDGWLADVRAREAGRLAGRLPRPARTLVVQNTTSPRLVTPLSQLPANPTLRLTNLTVAQVKDHRVAAQTIESLRRNRVEVEKVTGRAGSNPAVLRTNLSLPREAVTVRREVRPVAPAKPIHQSVAPAVHAASPARLPATHVAAPAATTHLKPAPAPRPKGTPAPHPQPHHNPPGHNRKSH